MGVVLILVVIGSSIWVAVDASHLGAKAGKGLAEMSPFGWWVACCLIWIIAVPLYLANRPALLAASKAGTVSQGGSSMPPPGWRHASDGKWYPPQNESTPVVAAATEPPPGWWLASDGKWYPPTLDTSQPGPEATLVPPGPGWWRASDGNWYPPSQVPSPPGSAAG